MKEVRTANVDLTIGKRKEWEKTRSDVEVAPNPPSA